MANQVYLALYKGNRSGKGFAVQKAKLGDWLTRKLTKGKYSHCEIAIETFEQWGQYDWRKRYQCYSSSIRDGGVRCKEINLDSGKWDLIALNGVDEYQIIRYFEQTKSKHYDWLGALGVVLFTPQSRDKFFCSEWCANAINGGDEGWRFSPNHLAAIFKQGAK
ncbi:enoyl-CoA hydratase [Avibacterium paragallinarum]|uniref:enoyl-CoA hydratase n=1 Tax=Avibacterium paragallinarum TaxID=728 RepID=UPI0010288EFA|nr:enoyl-CoA hydratase [Avibacterium paragallinarum]RZN59028.1 enoyl-CoA hydratase [Avibacterium paragallinarum]TID28250.1 enoyl-CoA hydratase [Avibacterium paragallinarum]